MLDKLKNLNQMAAKNRENKDMQDKLAALNQQVAGLGSIKSLSDIAGKGFDGGAPPAAVAASEVVFKPPSLDALNRAGNRGRGAARPPWPGDSIVLPPTSR
jgi:hypothetical protein